MHDYVSKQRNLVIRHASGDRIVALIEVVSPGNKASTYQFETFVEKALEALSRGYHLLVDGSVPAGAARPERHPRGHLEEAHRRPVRPAAGRAADPGRVLGRADQAVLRRAHGRRPGTGRTCRSSWTRIRTSTSRWRRRTTGPTAGCRGGGGRCWRPRPARRRPRVDRRHVLAVRSPPGDTNPHPRPGLAPGPRPPRTQMADSPRTGPPDAQFPTTCWSLVARARADDPAVRPAVAELSPGTGTRCTPSPAGPGRPTRRPRT